jgi:hypothetical protein
MYQKNWYLMLLSVFVDSDCLGPICCKFAETAGFVYAAKARGSTTDKTDMNFFISASLGAALSAFASTTESAETADKTEVGAVGAAGTAGDAKAEGVTFAFASPTVTAGRCNGP